MIPASWPMFSVAAAPVPKTTVFGTAVSAEFIHGQNANPHRERTGGLRPANRFTRAIAVGNPREFTQAEKEEQEIAEACNRLIKNSIVCWNYLYLARQLDKSGDGEARESLRRFIGAHSPMSWAHVNMLGEYDFSDEKLRDSIGILPLKPAA